MSKVWVTRVAVTPGIYKTEFPLGTKLLCVNEQHNLLAVHALVEPGEIMAQYEICVVETNQWLPCGGPAWEYLGTVLRHSGAYVLHVFWR